MGPIRTVTPGPVQVDIATAVIDEHDIASVAATVLHRRRSLRTDLPAQRTTGVDCRLDPHPRQRARQDATVPRSKFGHRPSGDPGPLPIRGHSRGHHGATRGNRSCTPTIRRGPTAAPTGRLDHVHPADQKHRWSLDWQHGRPFNVAPTTAYHEIRYSTWLLVVLADSPDARPVGAMPANFAASCSPIRSRRLCRRRKT